MLGVLVLGLLICSYKLLVNNNTQNSHLNSDQENKSSPKPQKNIIYENDMRLIKYEFIKHTEKLSVGDYVDIRISFSDGLDFIILSKKKIEDISQSSNNTNNNAVWLIVSEEELLRMSSAVVDSYINNGCSIYAIEYVSNKQEEATVNYPVNEIVKQLIAEDPNIISKAKRKLISSLRNKISMQELEKPDVGQFLQYDNRTEPKCENVEIEYLD